MRTEYIISSKPVEARNGILVLSGYGISVSVEHGLLTVTDGVGRDRRFGAFPRASSGIKRLIVLGHAGTISFEALRWLHDIGAAFAHIDADGSVVTASAKRGLDDPRLRRSQALATTTRVGLDLTRKLLTEKVQKQEHVLDTYFPGHGAEDAMEQAIAQIQTAVTPDGLRSAEAMAAAAYWSAWKTVSIQFARRDAARVRAHWTNFGSRTSPLTSSPRKATTPTNAILNLLYALAEVEIRVACIVMGLDPGMGLLHADQKNRDSLALDILEFNRPLVDEYVLDLLRGRVFSAKDFFETREGVCRVLPPLAHLLAESKPRWSQAIAAIVEWVAAQLSGAERIPTLLTQSKRSAGRLVYRRRERPLKKATILPAACIDCGRPVECSENIHCDECGKLQRLERLKSLRSVQHQTLRSMRAQGLDPAHGGRAAELRGRHSSYHLRANAEWSGDSRLDSVDFERDIRPKLGEVGVTKVSRELDLSVPYAYRICRGSAIPHRRHWGKLLELVRG